jgi:putative transposase
MPRSKREDYPGAWHHVMNRGARRAPIFTRDADCIKFLSIVGDVVERHGIEVHAYSLMPNHYHLLVRTPLANLSRCMRHLNGTYTLWLNKTYNWDGPVFRGRYQSQVVEDEKHLRILLAYIHLNPISAHLAPRLDSFAWTSHRIYLGRGSVPDWLSLEHFLRMLGGAKKLNKFVQSVRKKAIEYPEDFDPETGLFGKKSIKRRQSRFNEPAGSSPAGEDSQLAEKVLAEVCRLTGASLEELRRREMGPRANPARRFAVWALQRAGDQTYRQIANALDMHYSQVAKLLSRIRRGKATGQLKEWIEQWQRRE